MTKDESHNFSKREGFTCDYSDSDQDFMSRKNVAVLLLLLPLVLVYGQLTISNSQRQLVASYFTNEIVDSMFYQEKEGNECQFQIQFLIKQNQNVGLVKSLSKLDKDLMSHVFFFICLYGYYFILGKWLMVFNLEKYVKSF